MGYQESIVMLDSAGFQTGLLAVALAVGALPLAAQAQSVEPSGRDEAAQVREQDLDGGRWVVRSRIVRRMMENPGASGRGVGLRMQDRTVPELTLGYYLHPSVSAELVMGVIARRQTLYGPAGQAVGSLRHQTPVLTGLYHFRLGGMRPYLGGGLAYTRFSKVNIMGGAVTVDRNRFSPVLQGGFTWPLGRHVSFNVDVKKVWLRTDVYLRGQKVNRAKLDPLLVGAGLSYRF